MATAVEMKPALSRPTEEQWRTIWLRKLMKTTETYTHVSKSAITRIRSPLSKINMQNIGKKG